MTRIAALAAAAGLAALLLAGCGDKAPPRTVHESMTGVVDPYAQILWQITNAAFNDTGDGLDASKISDADWARLQEAGEKLKEESLLLARAEKLKVAAPGVKLEGEGSPGAPTAAQVQDFIQRDPQGFAERARALANAGETVRMAAAAKDVGPVFGVANGLDELCDSCHGRYWDPIGAPPKK